MVLYARDCSCGYNIPFFALFLIIILQLYLLRPKKHFKMNKEVSMLLPKKDLIRVEYIGKINNYYEDIYIPPYNNTD